MKAAELNSDFKLTTGTPYLTLMGELWGVYCEDLEENWLYYTGTTLYIVGAWHWSGVGWLWKQCLIMHTFVEIYND